MKKFLFAASALLWHVGLAQTVVHTHHTRHTEKIHEICPDYSGGFWVHSDSRITHFDSRMSETESYPFEAISGLYVKDIVCSQKGELFALTNDEVLSLKNGTWEVRLHKNEWNKRVRFAAIEASQNGVLYVSAQKAGLLMLSGNEGVKKVPSDQSTTQISTLLVDERGTLWVYDTKSGLSSYSNQTWQHYGNYYQDKKIKLRSLVGYQGGVLATSGDQGTIKIDESGIEAFGVIENGKWMMVDYLIRNPYNGNIYGTLSSGEVLNIETGESLFNGELDSYTRGYLPVKELVFLSPESGVISTWGNGFVAFSQTDNTVLTQTVEQPSTTSETEETISVYPNPAQERLNIIIGESRQINELRIVDLSGRALMRITPSSSKKTIIDIQSLAPGQYILQTESAEHQQSIPFIKL